MITIQITTNPPLPEPMSSGKCPPRSPPDVSLCVAGLAPSIINEDESYQYFCRGLVGLVYSVQCRIYL